MRLRAGLFVAVALVGLLAPPGRETVLAQGPAGWGIRIPPLEASYSVPALPPQSPRIASYTIEARLDPERHAIDGSLLLDWRNATDVPLSTFPFHLYWNAFRNTLSTTARGERRARAALSAEPEAARSFGYIQVRSVRLLAPREADLTASVTYVQPDDGNADDRTVLQVTTPGPVPPGASARFRIEWTSRVPYGDVGRAGWVHDYNFIAQWFPKIGVYWNGEWNAHQFHSTTEFFADYGNYDVTLTLPKGFVVGATGALQGEPHENADGTVTHRFAQEDVHDFAWTASRRYQVKVASFSDPGYPPVEIRLLVQPEHLFLADRYIEATRVALRSYGTWSAPYPYRQITVVDPAWGSAAGGMEYPTLFTGGASIWAPPEAQRPESVTIHECGHQFWYGLVGNNEFEEAWLDEGFNTYHDEKAAYAAYGPAAWDRRYFGVTAPRRGTRGGFSVVAPGVFVLRGEGGLQALRRNGQSDAMARRAWEYRNASSYTLNAYDKPGLSLLTLERLVGDDTMTRILRTYARRFRYAHPTSEDFIAVVNEVTEKDYRWFFDQTWFSSSLCDYAIEVRNENRPTLAGYVDGPDGGPVPAPTPVKGKAGEKGAVDGEVTVRRRGEVRMPVEVLVQFENGHTVTEHWDGQYRWARFRYPGGRIRRAVVDPEHKLALDVNPANNSWAEERGAARRASFKWAARFLFWLQNLLELHTVVG
jgi:Peptidase family M1 domain